MQIHNPTEIPIQTHFQTHLETQWTHTHIITQTDRDTKRPDPHTSDIYTYRGHTKKHRPHRDSEHRWLFTVTLKCQDACTDT